jgi:hypothetical protein
MLMEHVDSNDAGNKHALDAIEHHQRNITYPIMYDLSDRLVILGSGTLFQHDNRFFIITAAHLFDDEYVGEKFDFEKIAGPDTRGRGNPTTLGQTLFSIAERKPFDFDMAIIEIYDHGKISRLKKEWTFLTIHSLALPKSDPLYCLGGYPSDFQKQHGNITHGSMLVVRTTRLLEIPEYAEKPVDSNIDIFCGYDPQGNVRQLSDKTMSSPSLQGVSGGSLFQYTPSRVGAVWTPAEAMKLVGIQSSASNAKKWFRAKNCIAISLAFRGIDLNLAKAINDQLKLP